jgi:hypothetical protein
MPAVRRVILPVAALAALAAAGLVGCGGGGSAKGKTQRTGSSTATAPANADATPPVVGAMVPVVYPNAGIRFSAPEGWKTQPGEQPLVATVRQGESIVAVWRYPRTGEQLPVTHAALQRAKLALVDAIHRRDTTFALTFAKLLHVGPERAVQVLGAGNVSGARRTIRSTHIYAQGAEFVVDEYAPTVIFARVDQQVFTPLLLSVKITPPRK